MYENTPILFIKMFPELLSKQFLLNLPNVKFSISLLQKRQNFSATRAQRTPLKKKYFETLDFGTFPQNCICGNSYETKYILQEFFQK